MIPLLHVHESRHTITDSLDRPLPHLASSLYETYHLIFLLTKHPDSMDSTLLLIIGMLNIQFFWQFRKEIISDSNSIYSFVKCIGLKHIFAYLQVI